MQPPVRIALAGIGGYGEAYIEALLPRLHSHNACLLGAVDPLPQRCRRLGELHAAGVPVFDTMSDLFDAATEPVDLVLIVTPIHLHAEHTRFALQHGSSVLCEKPLAGTVLDALRMLEANETAAASGRRQFTAIGYQWSFSQAVQSLKRDILAGVLGRPLRMRALVYFPRPLGYFCRNDWAGRIRTADGHGVFDSPANNAAAHYLHNMFYLLGPSRQASAMPAWVQAELYRANDIENYDTAAIRCHTRCGAEILFYATHAVEERRGPRCRFEFEEATVEFDALGTGQFTAHFHDGRIKSYGHPNLDRHEKIWQSIEAVRTDGKVACGIDAALAHTLCVAAAQESALHITDFPERLKRSAPLDGDTLVYIDGLADQLGDCYQQGILPSQSAAISWSRPGTRVDVTAGHERPPTARARAPVSVELFPTVPAAGVAIPPA